MFSQRIRRILKSPDRPIAIRTEYITESKTTLVLRPHGDAQSSTAYRIEDEDGRAVFCASGLKFNDRTCREFRDASGLPLFELHRRILTRNIWSITLPGSERTNVATGARRFSWGNTASAGNFYIVFDNAAAVSNKDNEEKRLSLEIERHGNALAFFDVVDGDRKVAEIRESILHNKKLALMPGSKPGYRPAMDVVVTAQVDLSLIAAIAVIASDWVFGSPNGSPQ